MRAHSFIIEVFQICQLPLVKQNVCKVNIKSLFM